MPRTILLVDDDREVQGYLASFFEGEEWSLVVEPNGDEALKTFARQPIDAVIVDTRNLGVSGFKLADRLRAHARGKDLPLVMLSGMYRGAAHKAEAMRRYRLLDYMDKPVQGERLVALLKHAFRTRPEASRAFDVRLLEDRSSAMRKAPASNGEAKRARPEPERAKEPSVSTGEFTTRWTEGAKPRRRDETNQRTAPRHASPAEVDPDRLVDEAQRKEKREVERTVRKLSEAEGAILRGSLRRMPFPRLLHRLYQRRASGALFLLRNKIKKIVYFDGGHPIFIKSNLLGECLGRLLVREKFINEVECEESVRKMKQEGRQQGAILIGMRLISPHNLRYSLERQLEIKLMEVFGWTEGEYRFRNDVPHSAQAVTLEMSNATLILAGIRQTYDEERLEGMLAALLDAYVHLTPDPLIQLQHMDFLDLERSLPAMMDGTRTLEECIAASPLKRQNALAVAYALYCAGMLVATAAPPRRPIRSLIGEAQPAKAPPEDQLATRLLEIRSQDHFALLGIDSSASESVIDQSFARAAGPFHPDAYRNAGKDARTIALEIFERLAEAHRVLRDPAARKRYLEALRRGEREALPDAAGRTLVADRHFRQGSHALREQRFADASEAFAQATEIAPEHAEYRAYLGWSLFQSNPASRDHAIDELKLSARLNPKLERAHLFLGYIYKEMGRLKQAELHFEQAIQCDPGCKPALRELRRLYEEDDPTSPRTQVPS